MVFGILLLAIGVAWFARSPGGVANSHLPLATPLRTAASTRWLLLAAGIMLLGTIVRLTGLDAHGISHPEVYIPGIDLPAGISEPPPRHNLAETLSWHWHSEPHPFGYYMAMLAWTKAFGAGIISIRMPEAILGILSIPLVYKVGSLAYGRRVGTAAAAMLALHGFHIFWSHMARMYVPGAFLGLAATWALLEMNRRTRPSPWLEVGYVAAVTACAMTVEFAWPLLFVHIGWTALHHRGPWNKPSRTAAIQAIALMVSAPMLSQAIIGARRGAAQPPTLDFLVHYFSFGLLFENGAYDEITVVIPLAIRLAILAASVALIILGLRVTATESTERAAPAQAAPSVWRLAPIAAGVAIFMLGLAFNSHVRNMPLVVVSILPLVALAAPTLVASLRPLLRIAVPGIEPLIRRLEGHLGLVALLAIAPTIILFIVSFKVELLAGRAFNIFVPYLLILIAAGAVSVARRRVIAAALAVGLFVLFGASELALRQLPASPRDYRGLASAMEAQFQPGDLVFVRSREWSHTPIFFYLEARRLVGADYGAVLQRSPKSRIWVILVLRQTPTPEMARALAGYRLGGEVRSMGAKASLYLPPVTAGSAPAR